MPPGASDHQRLLRHPIHGRWPKVAAIAAPISSVAWYTARTRLGPAGRWRWAALPVLLWHQVEEWVWPGGFIEWLNCEVLGSSNELAPLTPVRAAIVNVRLGWSFSLATSAIGDRFPAIAIGMCASNAANAAMHLGWAGRHRRWDPGVVTAALLLLPWSAVGLRKHLGSRGAPVGHQAVGLLVGVGSLPALLVVMRRGQDRGLSEPPDGVRPVTAPGQ